MNNKLSLVINTKNEEKNIRKCIDSAKDIVSEIIVVDMESTDETKTIAKKYDAKVFNYQDCGYVEPARNFAINKATNQWILILDADETIAKDLKTQIKNIVENDEFSIIRIPRKNIVFNKWIKHSNWWPDYQTRLFKKDSLIWTAKIHSTPKIINGKSYDMEAKEELAIIHENYQDISQYIQRLDRYTTIDAQNYSQKLHITDFISRPINEFLTRFLKYQGFRDGLHGLVLAILQAFYEFVVICKVWEKQDFTQESIKLEQVKSIFHKGLLDFSWWEKELLIKNSGKKLEKFYFKILRKLNL